MLFVWEFAQVPDRHIVNNKYLKHIKSQYTLFYLESRTDCNTNIGSDLEMKFQERQVDYEKAE